MPACDIPFGPGGLRFICELSQGALGARHWFFAIRHLTVATKPVALAKYSGFKTFLNGGFRSGVTVALYQVSDKFVLS